MKLSNSFRKPRRGNPRNHEPPGRRPLPKRSAPRKPAPTQSLTTSALRPQAMQRTGPKAKNADTFPPPPHREGDEAVETQGHTQPTRKPSGVAVGERASRGTDFRCQTLFGKIIVACRKRRI